MWFMANIFNAHWVVYYNPGQYQSMQEKFFVEKRDAQAFIKAFNKQNPHGQTKCFGWNPHGQEPIEDRRLWADEESGLGEFIPGFRDPYR
jgi:hypothetical protein